MHRFVWDLRGPMPESVAVDLPISANDDDTPRVPQGALAVPGRYTVKLTVDGVTRSQPLELVMDPRIHIAQSVLENQYAMAHDVSMLLDRTYDARERALKRHDTKAAELFTRLNGELTALTDLVDGADAPVPGGTVAAYCSLRAQTRTALGERNSPCMH